MIIKHSQATEKRCARCGRFKPVKEFNRCWKERILANGDHVRYVFPAAYCKPCRSWLTCNRWKRCRRRR